MARSIRIPFLLDLKKVDSKAEARTLDANADVERRFDNGGPLLNRLLVGNVTGVMQVDGKPMPLVLPRSDVARAQEQQALRARLDPAATALWDAETLAALVAAVSGRASEAAIGPAAQQAVGRLFVPTYAGDAASFAAARPPGGIDLARLYEENLIDGVIYERDSVSR